MKPSFFIHDNRMQTVISYHGVAKHKLSSKSAHLSAMVVLNCGIVSNSVVVSVSSNVVVVGSIFLAVAGAGCP